MICSKAANKSEKNLEEINDAFVSNIIREVVTDLAVNHEKDDLLQTDLNPLIKDEKTLPYVYVSYRR